MHFKSPGNVKFYSFFLSRLHSVIVVVIMPIVNNVEDARVEIAALRKERSLLLRLSALIRDEVSRLRSESGRPLRSSLVGKITNT